MGTLSAILTVLGILCLGGMGEIINEVAAYRNYKNALGYSFRFYAVTAAPIGQPAPEETDRGLRALLDWILSPQGQQIIEDVGYVALQ